MSPDPETSRLRIAQVVSSDAWGGLERAPVLLARGLKDLGHEVSLWADPGSPAAEEARKRGIPVLPFRWRGYLDPLSILQAQKNLRQTSPQVLHLHHSKDLWTVVPALHLSSWKGPLILTKHMGSFVKKKDFLHAFLYRRVDRVLTCSQVIRRNVLETCPVPEAKVDVSYVPVDLEQFRFDPEARRLTRNRWEVLEGRPVVGMAARLTPGKGHETLLKAAVILKADFPLILFKMAGEASPDQEDFKKHLFQQRDDLGLKKQFEFEGYVPDVTGFLSALDLVVHAAGAEAFGMAAVEALACGRPVVGRAGEGLDEILAGGKGGVLVPSDEPGEWAAAIREILLDQGLYLRLVREARPVASRFSLPTIAGNHERWYSESLRGKGILTET